MAGSQKVAGMHISMTAEVAQAIRNIDKITKTVDKYGRQARTSMNRAQYAFNRMRRAAQLFASAFIIVGTIRSMVRFAASIEKAEEKLVLMQARFAEFGRTGDAFARVYQLSQELGVSLDVTAQGMTRLYIATKRIGSTVQEVENVQRNIILLGRAGGTSVEEMRGGLIQLAQGMASGRLQGEELRSVLENLPLVAMEIADALGIDIGQIRQFAADGKITSRVIVKALQEVNVAVEELPETFSMATARMANAWTAFTGALGKKVDTGWINELAKTLDTYTEVILNDFTKTSDEALQQYKRITLSAAGLGGAGLYDRSFFGGKERSELGRRYDAIIEEEQRRIRAAAAARRKAVAQEALAESAALEQLAKIAKKVWEDVIKNLPSTKYREFLLARNKYLRLEMESGMEYLDGLADDAQDSASKAARILNELATPVDKFVSEMKEARELFAEGLITQEELDAWRDHLIDGLDGMSEDFKETTEEMSKYADQAARNIQSAFADFLFDPLEEGLDGLLKNFVNVIRRILAEMFASQILNSGVGTAISGLFTGKAMGGPVTAGMPYVVGEQGPELFMPRSSGMIVPNHKLGGGGVNVSYSIDARGADEAAVVARMIPLLERTKEITKGEVRREMREGRFQ